MLKLANIGVGNAGGQVVDLAKKIANFEGIAINSSENDLSNICHVSTVLIGDEKGAGKDRKEALKFIRENFKALIKHEIFVNLIMNHEVIFIHSSTGGGTGSGTAPVLCEILSKQYPKKRFILVGICPPISESVGAQENTINYLKEVRANIPDATYMLFDNHRRSTKPTDEMMLDINRDIVEDLCIIRGDYNYATPYNSIDEKDTLRMLWTPGRLSMAKIYGLKEKDLDEKSIEDHLVMHLKSASVEVELERDRIVKRMGLITNLNEKLHRVFDTKLSLFREFVGEPVEGFEHIFINKEESDPTRVIVILAGLSIPDDRIQKIQQRVDEALEQLSKTKTSSILDTIETKSLSSLRDTGAVNDQPNDIDINDVFAKYN